MRMLVLTLLTFKKVKLIFGHPVLLVERHLFAVVKDKSWIISSEEVHYLVCTKLSIIIKYSGFEGRICHNLSYCHTFRRVILSNLLSVAHFQILASHVYINNTCAITNLTAGTWRMRLAAVIAYKLCIAKVSTFSYQIIWVYQRFLNGCI